MSFTFRTAFRNLVPWWLSEGDGELVLHSLGTLKDAFHERIRLATLARFPEYAPADALALIGQARRMRRGTGESREAYARRLTQWRQFHKTNGNPFAMLRQIRTFLNRPVRVRTVDARGNWYTIDADGTQTYQWKLENWDWDGTPATPEWAKFWVIIYSTGPQAPWQQQVEYTPNGIEYGEESLTWGTTATTGEVSAIRAVVEESKPLHAHIRGVIVAFDDASFDPDSPEPNGTWGNYSQNMGGVYRRTRLDTARYWHWS